MRGWMIRATEEDVAKAKSLLLDTLRAGKISHAEYVDRLRAIDDAKFVGDVYDQVFASSAVLRRRGRHRYFSVRKLNILCLAVSFSVFLGLGAGDSITWIAVGTLAALALFANGLKLFRASRSSKRSLRRSVDL